MTNSEYRIDSFKYYDTSGLIKEHKKEYFDSINKALKQAAINRKHGYKTFILEHICDGCYNPLEELTD